MCTVLSEPPQSPLLLLQPDHHMESRHREGQSIIESRTEWRQRRRRRRGGKRSGMTHVEQNGGEYKGRLKEYIRMRRKIYDVEEQTEGNEVE